MEQVSEGRKVTVVLTSCGRHDLLHKTIESFFKFNTYPIERFIVFEDGGEFDTTINDRWPDIDYIGVKPKVGQIVAIDTAYKFVKTPYIFHLEDDWEFYREGFIEKSMDLLEEFKNCICVWLRERNDTNKHPLTRSSDPRFDILSTNYHWKGFTFNPGLRRLKDYERIGSYGNVCHYDKTKPWLAEQHIGYRYHRLRYTALILKQGYVKHIGDGRHIE